MTAALKKEPDTGLAQDENPRDGESDGAGQEDAGLATASAPKSLAMPDLMKHASEVSGRSLHQILSDMARLAFGPGKISTEEYFSLSLFDDAVLNGADKRAFVGLKAARQIWVDVNHRHDWFGFVDDKLAVEAMFRGSGFRTTKTTAIYGSDRAQGDIKRLNDGESLKAFLSDESHYPLFGKPMSSLRSFGAASFEGVDTQTGELIAYGNRRLAIDMFVDDVMEKFDDGYIFQAHLKPHRDIAEVCGERVATVRLITLDNGNGPEIFRAAWKVPVGDSVADNYWRGNVLTSLDIEMGRVRRAYRPDGVWSTEVTAHPDSAISLSGFQLPLWKETVALTLDAASTLPHVPLVGWDIAVTDEGPVIVEPNHTPDFILPQIADRRGVLDERLTAAIERGRKAARERKRALKTADRRDGRARVRDAMEQVG